jgi:L-lactate dehydrogenase complex protein LldG
MSSRDDILASIRANLPRLDRKLPLVPLFDDHPAASLLAAFKDNLERMGGGFLDPPAAGDPLAPIREKIANAKIICSVVPEIAGTRDIGEVKAAQELADVDFGIVRASFAVAETGSVLLSDADLRVNAVAYLAQHLIVLLDPADIVVNLHHAYRRPEFRERHYASFHTGPSATADIEGVLIHGAQGVRSLSVVPIVRAAHDSGYSFAIGTMLPQYFAAPGQMYLRFLCHSRESGNDVIAAPANHPIASEHQYYCGTCGRDVDGQSNDAVRQSGGCTMFPCRVPDHRQPGAVHDNDQMDDSRRRPRLYLAARGAGGG